MKKSSKVFLLIALMLMFPLVYTFGCKSAVDKVEAQFSQTEFVIDMDDKNAPTSFDVKVSGLSGNMTQNLEFNYEKTGIVTISDTPSSTLDDGTNTYSFTLSGGGKTNVNVIHRDTNKNLGTLSFNVIKKLESISLKQNVTPYVVLNENSVIDIANFNLNPANTTQTNIKFRFNDNNSIIETNQDGSIRVTQMPANGKISVTAYSDENPQATTCNFELTVVEKPNVNNLTIFDYEDKEKVYYSVDSQEGIVLIKDFAKRNSIDFNYEYLGEDVNIEFSSNNETIMSLDEVNDYYNIFAKNVGVTSIRCKLSVVNFENVYSIIDILVRVVKIPKNVYVNDISGTQDLKIYSNYANQSGYKMILSVDDIDSLNNGKSEIQLELDNKDLFTLYYADGITEIDTETAVLKNNEVIYIVANEDKITDLENVSSLKVYSKRAKEVGEDVSSTLNLTACIGAKTIGIDYVNRQDDDKTIYVEINQTAVVSYKVNTGAEINSLEISKSSSEYANLESDINDGTITITPRNIGKFNIQLKTDNGTISSLIPVYVYKALDEDAGFDVRFENDDFVTNKEFSYGELQSFALMVGHGATLKYQTATNSTIYSSEIVNVTNSDICTISSGTNYIFASKSGNMSIRAVITTLRSEVTLGYGNGNAFKDEHSSNLISIDTYRAISNISLRDGNGNTITKDASIYMNNENLDWYFNGENKQQLDITPIITPSNTIYQTIDWTTSSDFLKVVYQKDDNGEYVLVDEENYVYEKYDTSKHLGMQRYTDKKVSIIANPSGSGYLEQSYYTGYVSCTITQFGKKYIKNFLVYAKNEVKPQYITTDKETVYEKYQAGQEIELNVQVDSKADNTDFTVTNTYLDLFDYVKTGNIVTIKPKKAGVGELIIKANGLRNKSGNYDESLTKTIKVVIADGSSKDTAYLITNEKEFLEMLRDNENHYYKLASDINLSSNITSSTFAGYLFADEGTNYKVTNIIVNDNKALFKNLTNSTIENINFYFVDKNIEVNQDFDFALLVNELDNSTLKNIYVNCNSLKVIVKNDLETLKVGGVVNNSTRSSLINVKVDNNLSLQGEQSINVTNLYVGLITASVTGGTIQDVNKNFTIDNYYSTINGSININNITSSTSYVGGGVGYASGSTISNIYSDVNVSALNVDNVASVIGYADNCTITHILSHGISQGNKNVGGLVGQLLNSNIDYSIYEMNYNSTRGKLNNLNLIYYVLGSQNVGGLVGLINSGNDVTNSNAVTISNSYVKSYQTYLIIKGSSNIGGLVGNQQANLSLSKTYASTDMIIEINSQNDNTETNSQIAGLVYNDSDSITLNIENTFFKGNISQLLSDNITQIINARPYANKITDGKTSYAVVNETHYLNGTASDKATLTTKETLEKNNGFNITNEKTSLSGKDWFISTDKNDGYPILVINDKVADNNVSKQELENALSNLDNITISSQYGTGKLTNGDRYVVLQNKTTYTLLKENSSNQGYLFDFQGLKISVSIISGNDIASLNNNKLILNQEGVVTLRISATNNAEIYTDVYVVSINKVSLNDFEINVLKDKTTDETIELDSMIVRLGVDKLVTNDYFTITGGQDFNSYYIFTTNKITVKGTKVTTEDSSSSLYAFVEINGEYVKLQINNVNLIINVTDKASNITVSATEISLSPMDEFDFNVTIENAQTNEKVKIISTDTNNNPLKNLTKNGKDVIITEDGKGINIPKFSLGESSNALVQLVELDNTTKNADNTPLLFIQNYKLKINSKYLDSANIIDFDDFDIKLTFNPSTNEEISKQLIIHITKQDILKMTMEYFSNGQTKIENNVEVFYPNEITTNTIIPGKTGILSINMFPTYSNFDGIYVTAVGENGEQVYLDQKVLVQYNKEEDDNTTATKEFISVRPNLTPVENGIYLRKVSNTKLTNGIIVSESNLKYDGNLYVMAYISTNTPKNVKFTFKVHTYRLDSEGNIDTSSIIESREFYLYSEEVPTITIDTTSLPQQIHYNGYDYYPLVKGQSQDVTYKFINFTQENENDVSYIGAAGIDVTRGIGYATIKTLYNATVGNTLSVYFSITKNVNGVAIESTCKIDFIIVDYIIEDFYLSKEKISYTEEGSDISTSIATSENCKEAIVYPNDSSVLANIPATLETTIYPILKIRGTISKDEYEGYIKSIYANLRGGNKYLNYNSYNKNDFEINVKPDENNVKKCELKITTKLIQSYTDALRLQLFWTYGFDNNVQTITLGNSSTDAVQKTIERLFTIDSTDSSSIESAYPIYDIETFNRAMTETGHWILMVDLDLTSEYSETAFTGFTPNFLSLNGNNHTITVPMLSKTATSGEDNVGFFKSLSEKQIVKNLKITYAVNVYKENENETVNEFDVEGLSTLNFGFFVGKNNGSIYNCDVMFGTKNFEYTQNSKYNVKVNFINTSSITMNVGGFAGVNETESYISNSYVNYNGEFKYTNNETRVYELNNYHINLLLNVGTTSKIAGFVVNNNGKLSKNAVYNIEIESQDDESVVSGFVVENQGEISECLVDNSYLGKQITDKYNEDKEDKDKITFEDKLNISTKGIVAGFVYNNSGNVINSYSNVNLKTPYRSAGFVYNNSGNVKTSYSSSKNATGEKSRANSLFTGTNELNEINNSGLIDNSYYLLDANEINEYKDVMFDEPAYNVTKNEFNSPISYYGFDFGVDPEDMNKSYIYNDYSIWKIFNEEYPTLRFQENRITYRVSKEFNGNQDQTSSSAQVKTYDGQNGEKVNNPYVVYDANSLLSVLNDASSAGNTTITKYIQLSNDIDMQEVENDSRFKNIQQATLVGGIDGNSFTINNLSVLISSQQVTAQESFGFFKQIGSDTNTNKFTTIRNLNINVKEMDSSTAVRVGLLAGKAENVQFVNINLNGEGVVVSGANMVGALVGQAKSSMVYISNVSSNLSVSAGYDSKNGDNYNSYAGVTIGKNEELKDGEYTYNAISYAGGLIGVVDSKIPNKFNIFTTKVYGNVTITGDHAGGIFGYVKGAVYDAKFELVEENNAQHINGRYSAGGLIAEAEENSKLFYARVEVEDSLVNSFDNANEKEGKKAETLFIDETIENLKPKYIGGLIGYDYGTEIRYAYSKVNVINYNAKYVGGLIGHASKTTKLHEVYVTGNVFGENAGGLIGEFINAGTSNGEQYANISGLVAINDFKEPTIFTNYLNEKYKDEKDEKTKNDAIKKEKERCNVYALFGHLQNDINLNVKNESTNLNFVYCPKDDTYVKGYAPVNVANSDTSSSDKSDTDSSNSDSSSSGTTNSETSNTATSQKYAKVTIGDSNSKDNNNVYSDRTTMKQDFKTTFNIGSNFNAENWKSINEDENYYPSFAFVVPSNIIYIHNENDLANLFGNQYVSKIIYLMDDIKVSNNFKGNISLTDCTFTSFGNTSHTISGIKLVKENNMIFTELNTSTLVNVKFEIDELDTTVTASTYGLLAGNVVTSSIRGVDVIFNQSTTGFTINVNSGTANTVDEQSLKTVGLVLGNVGASSSENSKIETLTVKSKVASSQTNLNIKLNNSDSQVVFGGLIGKASKASITGMSFFGDTNDNINITQTGNQQITIGGLIGDASSVQLTDYAPNAKDISENSNAESLAILVNANLVVDASTNNTNSYIGGIFGNAKYLTLNATDEDKFSVIITDTGSSKLNIGGFAGSLSNSKISNIKINNSFTSTNGKVAGFVFSDNGSTISDSYVKGDLTSTYASAYGFSEELNGSTISNCATYGNINTKINASGFAQTVTNGSITSSFAYIEFGTLNKGYVSGFVNSNSGTITNCYASGKIVKDNYESSVVSGFVNSNSGTIDHSFTVVAIMDGSLTSVGFARTNSGTLSECYYVYNLTASEHNGLGTPVDYINLCSKFLSNNSTINNKYKLLSDSDHIYPYLKSDNGSLESKFIGDIFAKGSALNPIQLTSTMATDNEITTEAGKYYYVEGSLDTISLSVASNCVVAGYNAQISTISSLDTCSLVSGIKVLGPKNSSQRAFVYINNGYIFNCHVSGVTTRRNYSNNYYGFVGINNGTISHCSNNVYIQPIVQFIDKNSTKTISGFVYKNNGNIKHCNSIMNIYPINFDNNNYEFYISGFVDTNIGYISNCYSVYSSTVTLNANRFYYQNQLENKSDNTITYGTITNCYSEEKANLLGTRADVTNQDIRSEYNGWTNVNKIKSSYIYANSDSYNYGYPYLVNYTDGSGIATADNTQSAFNTTEKFDNETYYQVNNPSDFNYYNSKSMNISLTNNINDVLLTTSVVNSNIKMNGYTIFTTSNVGYNRDKGPLNSSKGVIIEGGTISTIIGKFSGDSQFINVTFNYDKNNPNNTVGEIKKANNCTFESNLIQIFNITSADGCTFKNEMAGTINSAKDCNFYGNIDGTISTANSCTFQSSSDEKITYTENGNIGTAINSNFKNMTFETSVNIAKSCTFINIDLMEHIGNSIEESDSNYYYGAICNQAEGSCTFTNIKGYAYVDASVNIIPNSSIGGIIGAVAGSINEDKTINFATIKFKDIENITLVVTGDEGGSSILESNIGGLIGLASNSNIYVENDILEKGVKVTVNSVKSFNVGGLIGKIDGATLNNKDVSNNAISETPTSLTIDTESATGKSYYGGIVGYANNSTIQYVSARCKVENPYDREYLISKTYYGGMVGRLENSTISNCKNEFNALVHQMKSNGDKTINSGKSFKYGYFSTWEIAGGSSYLIGNVGEICREMINSKISEVETTQTIYLEEAKDEDINNKPTDQPVYKVAFLGVASRAELDEKNLKDLKDGEKKLSETENQIQYNGKVRFYDESGAKINYNSETKFNILSSSTTNNLGHTVWKCDSRNVQAFIGGYISSWSVSQSVYGKNILFVPIDNIEVINAQRYSMSTPAADVIMGIDTDQINPGNDYIQQNCITTVNNNTEIIWKFNYGVDKWFTTLD